LKIKPFLPIQYRLIANLPADFFMPIIENTVRQKVFFL